MNTYRAVILIDGSVALQDARGNPITVTRDFSGRVLYADVAGGTLTVHTDRGPVRFAIRDEPPHLERY